MLIFILSILSLAISTTYFSAIISLIFKLISSYSLARPISVLSALPTSALITSRRFLLSTVISFYRWASLESSYKRLFLSAKIALSIIWRLSLCMVFIYFSMKSTSFCFRILKIWEEVFGFGRKVEIKKWKFCMSRPIMIILTCKNYRWGLKLFRARSLTMRTNWGKNTCGRLQKSTVNNLIRQFFTFFRQKIKY